MTLRPTTIRLRGVQAAAFTLALGAAALAPSLAGATTTSGAGPAAFDPAAPCPITAVSPAQGGQTAVPLTSTGGPATGTPVALPASASAAPPAAVATPVVAAAGGSALPFTGGNVVPLVIVGLGAIAFGVLSLAAGRRRTGAPS